MTEVIATFRDEDGMEVRVAKIATSFSVTLLDLDSGEVVPTGLRFSDATPDRAIAKARSIAGL